MHVSKKRKKNYYMGQNKKSRTCEELRPGMKGFMITYSDVRSDRDTVMEAYRILNEYADTKYGPECIVKEEDDDDDDVNIEDALQKEVSDIKKSNAKGAQRRFQSVKTKSKNVIFIKTDVDDPSSFLNDIFLDLLSSQIRKTRHCLRFLPVVSTCYAKTENIVKHVKQCIESVFVEHEQQEVIKFCIVWKTRCNNSVKRDDILPPILEFINSKVEHETDYDNPELVVNIGIVGNICCIGLLRDYMKLRKYNIDLIVQSADTGTEKKKPAKSAENATVGEDEKVTECEVNKSDEIRGISVDVTPVDTNEKEKDDKETGCKIKEEINEDVTPVDTNEKEKDDKETGCKIKEEIN